MIARPKISRNEWKTAEIGAFEVGNFALLCCPVRHARAVQALLRGLVDALEHGVLVEVKKHPEATLFLYETKFQQPVGERWKPKRLPWWTRRKLRSSATPPPEPEQEKGAKFPTSMAPISALFHSFRLIFGRAIISRNGLEAWMLFSERARAEHSR